MHLKHFIRDSWLTASYFTGVSQLYHALRGRKRAIVTYHNTLPMSELPQQDAYNVDVTAAVFDKQLTFLNKHFDVRSIQEIENPEAQGVFLTVDDGMLNNYNYLVPTLERHGLTALFGVCPDFIDGHLPHIWRDHLFLIFRQFVGKPILLPVNNFREFYTFQSVNEGHRLMRKYVYDNQIDDVYGMVRAICERNNLPYQRLTDEPERFDFMNWQQIKTITKKGNQIASHTMSHRILRFLTDDEKRYELIKSKQRIENQLNTKTNILIYPYGGPEQIDEATVRIAQEAGYTMALMNVQKPVLVPQPLAQARFALPPTINVPHLHAVVSGYKFFLT
jgi:peptidoglycan/xylan/chitin deacetylase (PgdA/CDA1 family)